MKREPKRTKTIVGVLGNPTPNFVSFVDNGANQRPFHAVKRAQPEETDMSKNPTTLIHRVVFSSAQFATSKAVEDFMTGKGYTDFEVVQDGGTFYVEDEPIEKFVGELRTVPHSATKGVTYLAGTAAEDTTSKSTKGEDAGADDTKEGADGADGANTEANKSGDGVDTDAADAVEGEEGEEGKADKDANKPEKADKSADTPAPRQRQRKGLVIAGKSLATVVSGHEAFADNVDALDDRTAKSFGEMLENYNGSMPPGMYDMADALMGEMRKVFRAGDVSAEVVSKLSSDFAGGVMALHSAYEGILANKATKSEGAEADANDGFLEALMGMLFDAPANDASKQVGSLVASIADLTAANKSLQTRSDQQSVQLIETRKELELAKTSKGARTLKDRKSTDADDTGQEAKKTLDAVEAENNRRVAKRIFGSLASQTL